MCLKMTKIYLILSNRALVTFLFNRSKIRQFFYRIKCQNFLQVDSQLTIFIREVDSSILIGRQLNIPARRTFMNLDCSPTGNTFFGELNVFCETS